MSETVDTGAQTLEQIGMAAAEGAMNDVSPEVVDTTPAPEPTAEVTSEPTAEDDQATSTEDDAAATAQQVADVLESVKGEAMKLDPDSLPEELRGFLKQFQADYTRKTQALKEERVKSAEEMAQDHLNELRAEIQALKSGVVAPTPTPAPESQPFEEDKALEDFATKKVEAELGKMITFDEFVKAPDNATIQRFLAQQTRLAAVKAVAEYHTQVVAPQVTTLQGSLTAQQEGAVKAEYAKFQQANPDLKPYEGQIAALYRSGMTLEDAATLVRKANTVDDAVARALATGVQMGQKQAETVAANKDKYSTPSSSTQGGQNVQYTPEMSFEDVAAAAARRVGAL